MFPPHDAIIYRNEAGEVLGWDVPSYEPREPDPYEQQQDDAMWEAAWEQAADQLLTIGAVDDDYDPYEDPKGLVEAKANEIVKHWRERGTD